MNTKKIFIYTLAFTVLTVPAIALAGAGHEAGSPEPVFPGSPSWFALIVVSVILMSALSYWVYRYIQVAPVKRVTQDNK